MYKKPELEVVELEADDILTTSIEDDIWDDGKDEDSTKDDEL